MTTTDFEPTPPLWVPGHDYLPNEDRSALLSLRSAPGVCGETDFYCQPTNPPSWNLDVAPGRAIVDGSTNLLVQGCYGIYSQEWRRVPVQPSHSTLDRIDVAVLHVYDQENSTEEGFGWAREVIAGEPGSGQPPDLPPNSLVLSAWEIKAGSRTLDASCAPDMGAGKTGLVNGPVGTALQLAPVARAGEPTTPGWPTGDTADFRKSAGALPLVESAYLVSAGVNSGQGWVLPFVRDWNRRDPYRELSHWPTPMVADVTVTGSVGGEAGLHALNLSFSRKADPADPDAPLFEEFSRDLAHADYGAISFRRIVPYPATEAPRYWLNHRTGTNNSNAIIHIQATILPRPTMGFFSGFDYVHPPLTPPPG